MQPSPCPELTVRAILTGMALGVLLMPCNVYSCLKIGWSFNMSLTAGLLPPWLGRKLSSAPAIGLAFVIPAWNSISMFLGGLAAGFIWRYFPDWGELAPDCARRRHSCRGKPGWRRHGRGGTLQESQSRRPPEE